jgi:heat shock protein HtpX
MFNSLKTTFLLGALTALFILVGQVVGGKNGMFMGLIIASVTNFIAYFFSDKIVLAQYGAKNADGLIEYADIKRTLETLAKRARMPTPRLYVLDMPTPNAFATGRGGGNSVVAVSHGLIKTLEPDEIAGVIAHELGHIKNGDMLTSTIASVIAGAVSYLANFAFYMTPRSSDRDERSSVNPIVLLAVVIFTPITATLIHLAISRTREFVADHFAGKLTHKPLALASALSKISTYATRYPLHSTNVSETSAHLFIINPFGSSLLTKLFSTHPPVQERIDRLKQMSREIR